MTTTGRDGTVLDGGAPDHEAPQAAARPDFRWTLAAIVVVAALIRIVFAVTTGDDLAPSPDVVRMQEIGENLAEGDGFAYTNREGRPVPTASQPPGLPFVLAAFHLAGFASPTAHRVLLALLAAVGVGLVALVGRRLATPNVGLGAAALAAVHPLWFQPSGVLGAETLLLVLVPAALLAALRLLDEPTYRECLVLGACLAAMALVRSETILFALTLGLPAVLLAGRGWPARGRAALAVFATTAVLLAPWLLRNALSFDTFAISTERGYALAGSWCERTFEGPARGSFDRGCPNALLVSMRESGGVPHSEAARDARFEAEARSFASDRLDEVPGVVLARWARTAGVSKTSEQLAFDVGEGRAPNAQSDGQTMHLLVLTPLATVGLLTGSRFRWRRWWVLLAGPAVVAVVTAVFYGSTRMRVPAEPAIVVFAAAGAARLYRWWRGRPTGDLDGLPDDVDTTPTRPIQWLRRRTRPIRWKLKRTL